MSKIDKVFRYAEQYAAEQYTGTGDMIKKEIESGKAELSALRARVEALEADKERTREAVKMARQQLRSTQINWQEGCLFDCDSFLNIALDVCPSCTWRGDVSLVNGECPYCKTNWHELRKAA